MKHTVVYIPLTSNTSIVHTHTYISVAMFICSCFLYIHSHMYYMWLLRSFQAGFNNMTQKQQHQNFFLKCKKMLHSSSFWCLMWARLFCGRMHAVKILPQQRQQSQNQQQDHDASQSRQLYHPATPAARNQQPVVGRRNICNDNGCS